MAQLALSIDLGSAARIGPGKIRLLELVDQTGSISAAGRAYRMTYKQAWLTVDELNRTFRSPVITAAPGGRHGGGAQLTSFGHEVVRRFRELERDATALAQRHLDVLEAAASPAFLSERPAAATALRAGRRDGAAGQPARDRPKASHP